MEINRETVENVTLLMIIPLPYSETLLIFPNSAVAAHLLPSLLVDSLVSKYMGETPYNGRRDI